MITDGDELDEVTAVTAVGSRGGGFNSLEEILGRSPPAAAAARGRSAAVPGTTWLCSNSG